MMKVAASDRRLSLTSEIQNFRFHPRLEIRGARGVSRRVSESSEWDYLCPE